MLALSDNELRVVVETAKQVPVSQRSRFLNLVAAKYKKSRSVPNENISTSNLFLAIELARRELVRVTAAAD